MTSTRTRPRHATDDLDADPSTTTAVLDPTVPTEPAAPADPSMPDGGPASTRRRSSGTGPTDRTPPARTAPDLAGGAASIVSAVAGSIALLGVLLLGFGVYLFALSGVQQAHAQSTLYKSFRNQLALAVAPTGPTGTGRPVAILNMPSMGLRNSVVVEGTAPGSLTRGPGHRVDTPLPGQTGVSVIYGRAATFGASFGHLSRLNFRDTITVTTAQGTSKYVVSANGNKDRPLQDRASNRLVLVTADSQTVPRHTLSVSATLVSQPFGAGASRPAVPASNRALQIDTSALQPMMMWSLLLVIVVAVTTLIRQHWAKWPTYLCTLPIALAVLWNVYENAAQLLPNVY